MEFPALKDMITVTHFLLLACSNQPSETKNSFYLNFVSLLILVVGYSALEAVEVNFPVRVQIKLKATENK